MAEEKRVVVDLRGIIKRFYIGMPNELQILNGMDIRIREGEFVAIVGESGSGKSTLMNISVHLTDLQKVLTILTERISVSFLIKNSVLYAIRKSALFFRILTLFRVHRHLKMLNFL